MLSAGDPAGGPDPELLERVARGDDHAFATFYDQMAPRLYGLVFKILNDPKEAEDVLQDGFMHVWNHAKSYDRQRSSPTTWTFMIFRNKAIDCLRARARRATGLRQVVDEPVASEGEDGAATTVRHEETGIVRSALSSIPSEQQEAIRLAFFSGLTHFEIADRLGQPVGTIKARIRRGLMKLGDLLTGKP